MASAWTLEAISKGMQITSHLPMQKMSTGRIEAEGGLRSFLRCNFYLLLPVLLTFFVLGVILMFALSRCLGLISQ